MWVNAGSYPITIQATRPTRWQRLLIRLGYRPLAGKFTMTGHVVLQPNERAIIEAQDDGSYKVIGVFVAWEDVVDDREAN